MQETGKGMKARGPEIAQAWDLLEGEIRSAEAELRELAGEEFKTAGRSERFMQYEERATKASKLKEKLENTRRWWEGEETRREGDADRVRTWGRRATAKTEETYDRVWKRFETWCKEQGESALPANTATVDRYIEEMLDHYKPKTLENDLAAIKHRHKQFGKDPTSGPPRKRNREAMEE